MIMGASHMPTPMSTVPVIDPTPGTLNCFLVEDSPLIRENLVATLQEMLDLAVVGQAEDEAAALRWLHDEAVPCDLLIIDLFLKRGSGMSLLPKARLLQPEAKLIVLTNYAFPQYRAKSMALGADFFFDKAREYHRVREVLDDLASDRGRDMH